jgi:hypothetical protein
MGKFAEFLKEQNNEKPYRFVLIWHDEPLDPEDTEKTATQVI